MSNDSKKHICVGLLAHVDAGKTTLSEGMLFLSGVLKTLGRVDHGNSFLDTSALERMRGITIFSKQAQLSWKNADIALLDTPGHVDFCAEMERTLQVLDAAILVISGTDGIQGHTLTLWSLLEKHKIPTFIFINKMDLAGADRHKLITELKEQFSDSCIDFSLSESDLQESIAMCSDELLEKYMNGDLFFNDDISPYFMSRKIFPCYFGAALSLDGVDKLLDGIDMLVMPCDYPDEFSAQIYKISRDDAGNRLTHMKITGGTLNVRSILNGYDWQEKVNQIRIYSGKKYQTTECVHAGQICTVLGLSASKAGEVIGNNSHINKPILEPVLTYSVCLPQNCDSHTMLGYLRQLEDEDPMLNVIWQEELGEIHVQLMGEIQLEVLRQLIEERFGVIVDFDTGNIVYKETISKPVIGVGHFEPLRHYAETHLLIEPLEAGSGIHVNSICSTDSLDINWQRLILTHITEVQHIGVLTGSALTDVKITLIAGKAHLKHTEGGDFREATYRAIRQGLMQAKNVLLEPYYSFRLELPNDCVGRAMNDIQRMHGSFETPHPNEKYTVLTGTAPVSTMRNYPSEVRSYTKGEGRIFLSVSGYLPCHNADEVINNISYDAEHDIKHPADSVFCSHGAGYTVKWNEVPLYQHVSSGISLNNEKHAAPEIKRYTALDENDAKELFIRTYGEVKNRSFDAFQSAKKTPKRTELADIPLSRLKADDYLLVDGYNIIFAWDELNALAKDDLSAARESLIRILSNFQGMRKCHVIVVFDAYRVKGNTGSVTKDANVDIVYTKEAETADMYIEKTSYDLSRKHRVRVATSDAIEQMIILGHGAERLSANDLKWEIEQVDEQISAILKRLK